MIGLLTKQLLRTHRKRLSLITALIVLALSIFVCIGLFVSNVNQQILDQTKPLVGADIIIESSQPLTEELNQRIETIAQGYPAELSRLISFSTNLTLSGSEANLVQVQGVEANYPLYGTITTKEIADSQSGVWVDQQTFDQYAIDKTIRIGTQLFPVQSIILERSSASINVFDEGRTIFLPYASIQSTNLTNIGSRVTYETLIKVDDAFAPELLQTLQNDTELSGVTQISDTKGRIGQIQSITDEFDRFITTVLIITFVLVATTIFISIRTFFINEQRTVGILKILGQQTKNMISLYGGVFLCCFAIGILIACGIGVLSISLFKTIPLTQEFVLYPFILWETVIIGCILAIITITLPLSTIAKTSGLSLLRPAALPKKSVIYKQTALLGLGIYGMYVVTLLDWVGGLLFLVGFSICLGIFALIIRFLLITLKKLSSRWKKNSYMLYDGIRTSVAPGNQSVLMSIGLCISTISLLVISGVASSFLGQLTVFNEDQPSLYVLNILPENVDYIDDNYPDNTLYDVILARIQSINGVALQDHLEQKSDGTQGPEESGGRFTREYNATTVSLPNKDYLTGNAPQEGEVSLEEGFAEGLKVELGDIISFFIQGRSFELQVTSLRKEKRTGGPFFFVQLPSAQFEKAPKTYFWTTDVQPQKKEDFKQSLVENLGPQISFVDTDEIIMTVQNIATDLIKVIWVLFNFLLFFVFVSIAVCLEAMKTLKQQKVMLYSLLGATSPMIKKSLYSEQIAIFGVATTLGVVVASGLLWYIFSLSELLSASVSLVMQLVGIVLLLAILVSMMVWATYRRLKI